MTSRRSALRFTLAAACLALATAPAPVHAGAAEVDNHEYLGAMLGGKMLEDPCGVAVSAQGDIYVADYDHHQVGRRSHLPPNNYAPLIENLAIPNGPCALALDAADNLYVNYFHGAVVRYSAPAYSTATVIDSAHATGLAVDKASGDLYVDERTSIAVYEAPVTPGAPSSRIGQGSLENVYGLARSPTDGRLYVADAATHTVKVFDPSEPALPVAEIDGAGTVAGRFVSLVDSSLAVDPSDGHLFVADNTQPGFEHPRAAISEFNAAGVFRGQLAKVPTEGAPVGIVVNDSPSEKGKVYVTTGNGQTEVLGGFDPEEESALLVFGPAGAGQMLQLTRSGSGQGSVTSSPAGIACPGACEAEFNSGALVTLTATPAPGSTFSGWSGACTGTVASCQVVLSSAAGVDAAFAPAPAPLLAPLSPATIAPAATGAAEAPALGKKPNRGGRRFARGRAISSPHHRRQQAKP